jgi:uncharacterized Zn-binding protein involved in type VI secretion
MPNELNVTLENVTLQAFEAWGPPGVATFAIAVEEGATVELQWQTDIIKSLSGLEQRASVLAKPRQSYKFESLLSDADHRRLLSTLAGEAAAAPVFLLGLAHEAIPILSSTSTTIVTTGLTLCDWAVGGQRVVVRGSDGTLGTAVVQGATGATLTIDEDLTAIAKYGAEVMPAMAVYLDADQGLARYPVNAGRWELVARAALAGFAPGSVVGTGAIVNTFDGLPVWDLGNALELAEQPLYSGAELVDLGGRISMLASYDAADWGRALRLEGKDRADWQFLKKFLDTIQGARRAFLLPTGRPDLEPVGTAGSGTLTIVGPTAGGVDYVGSWFTSLAHRRLRLTTTAGVSAYREVTSCADSGATQDLTLDSGFAGTLAMVEFLEQVRLEDDRVSVSWNGLDFETTMQARVVQR